LTRKSALPESAEYPDEAGKKEIRGAGECSTVRAAPWENRNATSGKLDMWSKSSLAKETRRDAEQKMKKDGVLGIQVYCRNNTNGEKKISERLEKGGIQEKKGGCAEHEGQKDGLSRGGGKGTKGPH